MIDADLGVVEAQCQAGDAVSQIEHLVEHDVGETFDACDAVADLPDDPDTLSGDSGLGPGNLCFDLS
jgi:hypothetical protein